VGGRRIKTFGGVKAIINTLKQARTPTPCFRVFKAHRLLYHSTLGLRVIKKKKKKRVKL